MIGMKAHWGSTQKSISTHGPEVILEGYDMLLKNLNTWFDAVSLKLAKTLAVIGTDLLANAQPRVPFDSGALRRSGTVAIEFDGRKRVIVGQGRQNRILANIGAVKADIVGGAKRIDMEISYYRMDEETGEDVALLTHEALGPFDERPSKDERIPGDYYAKQPGTGPKYLEIPWMEKRDTYYRALMDAVSEKELAYDIELISKIYQNKTGQYTVDLTELVHSKIDRIGYFGNFDKGESFT